MRTQIKPELKPSLQRVREIVAIARKVKEAPLTLKEAREISDAVKEIVKAPLTVKMNEPFTQQEKDWILAIQDIYWNLAGKRYREQEYTVQGCIDEALLTYTLNSDNMKIAYGIHGIESL